MNKRDFLTTSQVAEICGVTSRTAQRWIKAGYFPNAWKAPGKTTSYHVPREEVEAFINRMSQELRAQWSEGEEQEEQGEQGEQDEEKEAAPAEEQQELTDHRAVLAALAETLQRLEERRTGSSLALIVEDDPDAGEIFEFTLKEAGFATSLVKSGEEALKYLRSIVPNLVVLDLHLPDISGTEVLQRMRASDQLAQVPVIVATAHPDMAEEIEEQAVLVLTKPVRYTVLQERAVEVAGA